VHEASCDKVFNNFATLHWSVEALLATVSIDRKSSKTGESGALQTSSEPK